MQAQLGHSDIRTTLDIYTRTLDPEVLKMANQVTNRILALGEMPRQTQFSEGGPRRPQAAPDARAEISFPDKIVLKSRDAERWPSG